MNNTATLDKMKELRLHGMKQFFELHLQTQPDQSMTADEVVSHLVQSEWEYRQNWRIKMALLKARFRYQTSVEEITFSNARNLDKNTFLRLAECSFMDKKENIIITGPTGVGKSYLASALGHQCCIRGYKVIYHNAAKLFSKLKLAKGDGTYSREISRIEKQELLVLDDFGLHPMDNATCLSLLEIMEDRHGRASTIIASQIPVSKWYELLEEKTVADAILDRIIHVSHRIELKGESLRKKAAK